jgi:hypothetical protein
MTPLRALALSLLTGILWIAIVYYSVTQLFALSTAFNHPA